MINTEMKINENEINGKGGILFDKIRRNLFPLVQTCHQVSSEHSSMTMCKHMLIHVPQVEIIVLIMD